MEGNQLHRRFINENAINLLREIKNKSYFRRYDLSEISRLLRTYFHNFEKSNKRNPFIYECLEKFLQPLIENIDSKLKTEINNILFQKGYDWFIKVGQYFFYNFYEWVTHIKEARENSQKFVNSWWNWFAQFENPDNVKNEVGEEKISYPEKVLLELTNNCNLNCIMCGIGKLGYEPSRNLPIPFLKDLCKDVLQQAKLIRLNGLGESTMLPNFSEYIKIIGKMSAQLEIVTNLTVQSQEVWELLLENNTNFLISCDSAHAQKFESIRRGATFDVFQKNLKLIGQNITNPLQAQIIFTLMEQNFGDLVDVVQMAIKHGLGGVIVNVVKLDNGKYQWIDSNLNKITNNFKKAFQLANQHDIQLKLPDHLAQYEVNSHIASQTCRKKCFNPWKEVYIRYNGDVTVCNMLNPYIYGNCRNSEFMEVWNGLNAKLFRRFVNTNYRHYYCKDCYYVV